MSSATTCGNHSGPSRTPFQVRPKSVRLPPGILFAFILESCSESTRNAVRLHPGNPFALARNPQLEPRFASFEASALRNQRREGLEEKVRSDHPAGAAPCR